MHMAKGITRASMLSLLLLCAGCVTQSGKQTPSKSLPAGAVWHKLDTVPYERKQDDIHFIDPLHGWYVNGAGKIYATGDGGDHWQEQLSQPGTYFRAVGFLDARNGLAGNIGTDYFPGVTDTHPLYRTRDGGSSWQVVEGVTAAQIKGVCAIDILHSRFINAGVLDKRTIVHVGGRVGGPAALMRSLDGGATWKTIDMTPHTAMILDVKFFDAMNGIVFGATDADVEKSRGRIIRTQDGGQTWQTVYESTRSFELIWKGSFATKEVGYATVQSNDPDPKNSRRYVVKTTDGGRSWQELLLVDDAAVREFGVGFYTADIGWVGASNGIYQTVDGGKHWAHVAEGTKINKIRVLPTDTGVVAYAIGTNVFKFDVPATQGAE